MDIQKIITDVIAKLKSNPDLVKQFMADPVKMLEKTFNVDLPDDQINKVIDGVKKGLGNVDAKQAVGLLAKIKQFFGK